jgi:hypothetical protein
MEGLTPKGVRYNMVFLTIANWEGGAQRIRAALFVLVAQRAEAVA